MKAKILIVDYGMNNLGSIARAILECGGDPLISEDPEKLKEADGIVLPGVGSFSDGMKNLEDRGF
ncbi:MAG: imidazole glycerol phosphate synthase subunit HisH, partial [Candidatus Paceibacterota bacterium]